MSLGASHGILAETRHHEMRAVPGRELKQRLGGIIPRVDRKIEGAPMHGQEGATAEQRQRL